MTMAEVPPEMTLREKLAVRLILWAVSIAKPWKYEHQHSVELDAIKEMLK